MKKFLKKCFMFTLVTLILSSCSAKNTRLEQLTGKSFSSKGQIIMIVGKEDVKNFSEFKENDLVFFDVGNINNYKIFKDTKIFKKNGKEFVIANGLDLHLEIVNNKTIKDIDNNIEYTEYNTKKLLNDLNSTIKITEDIRKIANKSFTSDSGVQIIFAITENGQANLFIKENGKENHYSNANLKQENGKLYITADGLKNKFVYSSINKIVDEDTKIEYKLNNKK